MTETNYQITPSLSRYLEIKNRREYTTDHLISIIEESNIVPLAMQTISPYKTLNQIQCKFLAGGIRDCIIKRLDSERRIPVFTP